MSNPSILNRVWGKQKGVVFISTKDRRRNSWRDHSFHWPEDKDKIADFVDKVGDDRDVYWAPAVFKGKIKKDGYPSRSKKDVKNLRYLYADLDTVHPSKCFIKPSIAWESSPGRYQAVWLLTRPVRPKDHETLNQRMTYAIGADKSGWDLTQVLRVPGTLNHKYVERPMVRVMWSRKIYYDPQELADSLPEIRSSEGIDMDEVDIELEDLRELVWVYKGIIGDKMMRMLFTPDSAIQEGERSDRLWELECRLLEAGVPVADVIRIIKVCPWNKFKGRRDEDKRILIEVLKAERSVKKVPLMITGGKDAGWETYAHFMGRHLSNPGWLIEGMWANASHGMIAGEAKTFKSTISREMAVSVASGLPMWDKFKVRNPGPVLIVQEENPPWVEQDRLIKIAQAKKLLEGRVHKVDDRLYVEFPEPLPIRILNNWGFDLTLEEHRNMLTEAIKEVKPVLLILDPLYLMLGDTDENSAQELRNVLQWLLHLKINHNLSVMVLHHWNKGGTGKSERGGQRMLGSATLHAWVDSAVYTSIRNVEENDVQIEREFRGFPKPENLVIRFSMSEPGKEPVYRVEWRSQREAYNLGGEMMMLEIVAANGSATATEIQKGANQSTSKVRRVMEEFVRMGLVTAQGGGRGRGKQRMFHITKAGKDYLKLEGGGIRDVEEVG